MWCDTPREGVARPIGASMWPTSSPSGPGEAILPDMASRTSPKRRLSRQRRADERASEPAVEPAPTSAPTAVDTAATPTSSPTGPDGSAPGRLSRFGPVLLLRAAHPRLALVSALALAGAAALSGRSTAAVGMVLLTALVGQAMLGWTNDLVDRRRDSSNERLDKPIAQGLLDPGDVAFAVSVGVLAVVPLAISHGVWSGLSYLAALAIGLLGTVLLRRGLLSWVTWAASYALYPAFLAYGGFAGDGQDTPPEIAVTVLAAALGVCVHVLVSLPGLVLDNENGLRHLPLRIALRVGAARLLWGTVAATALVLVGLLVVGAQVGLRQ